MSARRKVAVARQTIVQAPPRPDLERLRDVDVIDKLPIGPGEREKGTHPVDLPRYANMGDVAACLIIRDLSAADPIRIRGLPGSPGIEECVFCGGIVPPHRHRRDTTGPEHKPSCVWLRAVVLSDTWDGIA